MTTTPDRTDADLALLTAFPAGLSTADGGTYYPTADKMLTALFRMLADEGLGVADGPNFTARPGMADAAADRLQELVGGAS